MEEVTAEGENRSQRWTEMRMWEMGWRRRIRLKSGCENGNALSAKRGLRLSD